MTNRRALALALLWPSAASAAEVDLVGYYRARMRVYDSLSLNRELTTAEGAAAVVEHRLWLRPRVVAGDDVTLYADILGLDGLDWGQSTDPLIDPVTGVAVPVEFTDNLTSTVYDDDSTDRRDAFRSLNLARAWGEVHTPVGRVSFGRMPLHWGLGIWQNDGLSWNGDGGDTADRVQWDHVFDTEKVFVQLSLDTNAEGLVNGRDDTSSATGVVGYRKEKVTTGLQIQYRTTPSRNFQLVTFDGAFDAEIGTLDLGFEAIGQFGSGNLAGDLNDISVAAFGGVLDATLHTPKIDLGLEAGLASGDGDATDARLKTFTFDRDYQVGVVMFEQAMPVLDSLATSGDGRDYSQTLSGYGVSNAIYFKPTASHTFEGDKFTARASVLYANAMAAPDLEGLRKSYGNELDLGAQWRPNEHFSLDATGALFLPGSFYSAYTDTNFSGFDQPVFGVQVIGQVRF